MNRLLLIAIMISSLKSFSQQTTAFEVSKISVQQGTKDQLYLKAKTWVVSNFNSAKDVIQMDDKSLGRIIIKGSMPAERRPGSILPSQCTAGNIYFTLTIDLKLNKSRIVFSEASHDDMEMGCDLGSKKTFGYKSLNQVIPKDADYNYIKDNAKLDFEKLIISLEQSLKSQPKKDNW